MKPCILLSPRIFAISIAVAFTSPGVAADVYWSLPSATSGDLLTGANWTGGNLPTPSDTAGISNGGTATLTSGTGAFTQVWVGQGGQGTQVGTIQQSGGTLTLSDGLVIGRWAGTTGTYALTGGVLNTQRLRIAGRDATANGTMTISGTGVLNTTESGTNVVAVGSGGNGSMTVSAGGTWNHTGTKAVQVAGDNTTGAAASNGTLNIQNGGTVSLTQANLEIGQGSGNVGNVNISGGALTLGSGSIVLGASGTGTGTLTITGGTVLAAGINKGTGTGTINFNGGVIKSSTVNANFFNGIAAGNLHVLSGGLKFDTNAKDVVITQALSGAGGLTKQGNGKLTLTGAQTYAGDTVIEGGTLSLGATASLADTGNVSMLSSTVFDLNNAAPDTIHFFIVDGIVQSAGTYGRIGSGAQFERSYISGNGFVFASVPEPSHYALGVSGVLAAAVMIRRRRLAGSR